MVCRYMQIYTPCRTAVLKRYIFRSDMSLGSLELRSKHVLCNSGSFIWSESQTLLPDAVVTFRSSTAKSKFAQGVTECKCGEIYTYTHGSPGEIQIQAQWNVHRPQCDRSVVCIWIKCQRAFLVL